MRPRPRNEIRKEKAERPKLSDYASLGTVLVAAIAIVVQAWSALGQSAQNTEKERTARAQALEDRAAVERSKRAAELGRYFDQVSSAALDVMDTAEGHGDFYYLPVRVGTGKTKGKGAIDGLDLQKIGDVRVHFEWNVPDDGRTVVRSRATEKYRTFRRVAFGRVLVVSPEVQKSLKVLDTNLRTIASAFDRPNMDLLERSFTTFQDACMANVADPTDPDDAIRRTVALKAGGATKPSP